LPELRHFANSLRRFMTEPALVQGPLSRLCPLGATEGGELTEVLTDPDVLLFLLHVRLKDWPLAFAHLSNHLQRLEADDTATDEERVYFRAVAAYLHLRAKDIPLAMCRTHLRALFGESLAAEVIDDLDPAHNPFRHQRLMSCGDCHSCTCQGICGYEPWKARWGLLLPKMVRAGIDQMRLREVFGFKSGKLPSKGLAPRTVAKASRKGRTASR
jgi:hypothetical protein